MRRARPELQSDISTAELLTILSIVRRASTILNLEELFRFTTETILAEHNGFQNASIWILDSDGRFLIPKSISGIHAKQLLKLHPNGYQQGAAEGIIGRAHRTGRVYVANDTAKDAHFVGVLSPPAKAELCVPIKQGRTVLGLLDVQSNRVNAFAKADVVAFQILADHIANSIKNAYIYDELRRVNRQLLEFQILGRQISGTLDLEEILHTTVVRLPEILSLRLCSVFLHNPITDVLELKSHNHPDLKSRHVNVKLSKDGILGQVVGNNRSKWIQDIEQEYRRRNRPKYRTKSSLNLILKAGEKLVGVLNLNDKRDGSNFNEHDFNLSDYFASHLALSINNCRLYERTLQMALFDGLTGLYVHRHFQEVLEREVARSARSQNTFSLMIADVDHFKLVNDAYGHQNGDTVLRELASIFKRMVRQVDFVARYGGEEFAFILPETDKTRARILAARIQRAVNATRFRFDRRSCRVSLSFGVAESDGTHGKDEVVRRADSALYAAKGQGRNLIVVDES